jgi:hypothetical protein
MSNQDPREPSFDQAIINLGDQAALVLENEAFKASFKHLREEVIASWANMNVRDTSGAQLMLQQIKIVDRLEAALYAMLRGADSQLAIKRYLESGELSTDGVVKRALRRIA